MPSVERVATVPSVPARGSMPAGASCTLAGSSKAVLGTDGTSLGPSPSVADASPEFARLWAEHPVAARRAETKRFLIPDVGCVQVDCEVLATSDEGQRLVLLSARPGTADADRLRLVGMLGDRAAHSSQPA